MLPITMAAATMTSNRVSRQRSRGLIGPRIDGSPAGTAVTGAASSSGLPGDGPRPLESQPDLPDLDHVAIPERRHLADGRAVDEGPVRAAEVLDIPRPTPERQDRVLGRRELIVDDDRVVDVAADRGDRIERERRPLRRLAARRRDDDQATELGARLARGRPEVTDERTGDAQQEQIQQPEEQQSNEPDGEEERVHQPAEAAP